MSALTYLWTPGKKCLDSLIESSFQLLLLGVSCCHWVPVYVNGRSCGGSCVGRGRRRSSCRFRWHSVLVAVVVTACCWQLDSLMTAASQTDHSRHSSDKTATSSRGSVKEENMMGISLLFKEVFNFLWNDKVPAIPVTQLQSRLQKGRFLWALMYT